MGHIPEGNRAQSRIMCLDDMVDEKAMVRIIDRFMDIVDLEELGFQNTSPKALGRNSYSPLTLAKLYVFCYEEGIRSSRRIEKACRTNIEVMWLVGGLRPDFKTIADFRRDNTDALSMLFYEFTSFADSAGLFGKKLIAIDGTKIKASNSKRRNISKKSLKRRIEHHKAKVDEYLRKMDDADSAEDIEELQEKARVSQRRADESEELLSDMDEQDIKEISLTDPDARCMGKGRAGMQVAYNVQSAVDSAYHLVCDYDITNRADDHGQLSSMALRVQETMRKCDITFLADKGYWGSNDLEICRDAGMDCIVAPQGKSSGRASSAYSLEHFTYDECTDSYICPLGKALMSKSKEATKDKIYSNKHACHACSAQAECKSSGLSYRRIRKRPANEILEWAERRYKASEELYKQRQQIVEHPFGTIKRFMAGDYFLLRGFNKVRCEASLLFMGYNLKRALGALGFDDMMDRLESYACLLGKDSKDTSFSTVFSLLIMATKTIRTEILGTIAQLRCSYAYSSIA
jgi:transposase